MAVTKSSDGCVYRLTAAADAIASTVMLNIRKIRWVGAVTVADNCELRCNAAGANDVIFLDKASVANYVGETTFPHPMAVSGVTLSVMTSGTLFIYTEN
jgi:hypothetical protein